MRLVELLLVVRVEVIFCEFELIDLALHFVEVLVHHVRVHVVDLRDVLDALLEVALILHYYLTLVLVVLQFQFVDSVLAFLPLVHFLLVLVVVRQQFLHSFEVCFQFGARFDDAVPEVDRYADLVVRRIDSCLLLRSLARLVHLAQFEVELVAGEANLLELLKRAHFVQRF